MWLSSITFLKVQIIIYNCTLFACRIWARNGTTPFPFSDIRNDLKKASVIFIVKVQQQWAKL